MYFSLHLLGSVFGIAKADETPPPPGPLPAHGVSASGVRITIRSSKTKKFERYFLIKVSKVNQFSPHSIVVQGIPGVK